MPSIPGRVRFTLESWNKVCSLGILMPSIPGYVRLFLTHLSLPSRYTYAQHTWSCSLLSPPSPYTAFMQSPYPCSVTSCTLLPVTAGLVVRVFCLLFIFNESFLTPLCRGHKRCFVYRRRTSRRPFINRFETPTWKNLMPIAKKDSR